MVRSFAKTRLAAGWLSSKISPVRVTLRVWNSNLKKRNDLKSRSCIIRSSIFCMMTITCMQLRACLVFFINRGMTRPFEPLYKKTFAHLHHHNCGTYPFGDGAGLVALAASVKPSRILELGTALGYTSCCFAKAAPHALIDTIDFDESHVALARANINEAGFGDQVTVHHGTFADVLPSLANTYDLAFFDGFVPDFPIIKALMAKLGDDGVLVCANLGLAEPAVRKQLNDQLFKSSHWQIQSTLENGGTVVVAKRDVHST